MKVLIQLVALSIGGGLMAQNIEGLRPAPEFTSSGKLLILRIIPEGRTAKIYVVGSKLAEVDLKKDAKILSVYLRDPNAETLQLNDRGDYYEVRGIPPSGEVYQLSIKTQVRGKTDEVPVIIRPKVP